MYVMSYSLKDLTYFDSDDLMDLIIDIRLTYRNHGKLEEARGFYRNLLSYFYGVALIDGRVSNRDITVLEYESGYVEFMEGNFQEAAYFFRKSSHNAGIDSDEIGFEIGRVHFVFNSFLSGNLAIETAREETINCLERFSYLYNKTQDPRAKGEAFNTANRVFEYSIVMGDAKDANERLNYMISSDYISEEIGLDHPQRSSRMKIKLSLEGRLNYVEKKYKIALECFAAFLDHDFGTWGKRDLTINTAAIPVIGLAREYLFAGRSFLALGNQKSATEIFERGLQLEPRNANKWYQDDIRKELECIIRMKL